MPEQTQWSIFSLSSVSGRGQRRCFNGKLEVDTQSLQGTWVNCAISLLNPGQGCATFTHNWGTPRCSTPDIFLYDSTCWSSHRTIISSSLSFSLNVTASPLQEDQIFGLSLQSAQLDSTDEFNLVSKGDIFLKYVNDFSCSRRSSMAFSWPSPCFRALNPFLPLPN